MAKPGETDDLDELIDRAVDTFFVEAPTDEEMFGSGQEAPKPPAESKPSAETSGPSKQGPTLDEAVDSLFMSSFEEPPAPTTAITSGDDDTDREIDLAVDTLFVEELEAPPPETTQLEVGETEVPDDEDFRRHVAEHARKKKHAAPAAEKRPAAETATEKGLSYDDAMAQEIQRHMHTVLTETAPPVAEVAPAAPPTRLKPKPKPAVRVQPAAPVAEPEAQPVSGSPLRKLQEAILTLEWEISRRSITVLATEIHKVRTRFQDNVTIDFAALSMRVVLEYVVKRMSRAHPESIRFLLEVSDYMDRSLRESEEDPLSAFHHILNRYERYKSIVRKAEGLPDDEPAILHQLEIKDPVAFYRIVDQQTKTIARAGQSLAKKLSKIKDPENLIRSFRFLVNRAASRILENTHKEKVKKVIKKRK
jgi:hypothetical protein